MVDSTSTFTSSLFCLLPAAAGARACTGCPNRPARPALPLKHHRTACDFRSISFFPSGRSTMADSDDTPMLVESPLNTTTDPEWELHFAVSLPCASNISSLYLSFLPCASTISNLHLSSRCLGPLCSACSREHRPCPAGAHRSTPTVGRA